MKKIKIKLGQETPLVWCGGEGVKNVVEKGLKLKGVDDEDVSSKKCSGEGVTTKRCTGGR
jgi:hypothetical protein